MLFNISRVIKSRLLPNGCKVLEFCGAACPTCCLASIPRVRCNANACGRKQLCLGLGLGLGVTERLLYCFLQIKNKNHEIKQFYHELLVGQEKLV